MNHDIHTFTTDGGKTTFQAALIDGDLWFRAMDIVNALGISVGERVKQMAAMPSQQHRLIAAAGEANARTFVNLKGAKALLRNKGGSTYRRWLTLMVPMSLESTGIPSRIETVTAATRCAKGRNFLSPRP